MFSVFLIKSIILFRGDSRLSIAFHNYNHPHGIGHNATLLYSDDAVWSEDFEDLHMRAPLSVFMLFCMIPFALQASALVTETIVLPILVIETVQAHVENFTQELDECK